MKSTHLCLFAFTMIVGVVPTESAFAWGSAMPAAPPPPPPPPARVYVPTPPPPNVSSVVNSSISSGVNSARDGVGGPTAGFTRNAIGGAVSGAPGVDAAAIGGGEIDAGAINRAAMNAATQAVVDVINESGGQASEATKRQALNNLETAQAAERAAQAAHDAALAEIKRITAAVNSGAPLSDEDAKMLAAHGGKLDQYRWERDQEIINDIDPKLIQAGKDVTNAQRTVRSVEAGRNNFQFR